MGSLPLTNPLKSKKNMQIDKETRKACKFYTTLLLGFILMVIGCFCPPLGVISNSILIGSGMLLTISAGCIGIDLAEIFHQIRLLRYETKKEVKEDAEDK